ncbi:MAG: hypothetical protein J4G12_06145 [Gemmatimonadetes bacterium]|nr:hypothetical protein [Gemmatimonadota bacterium]
MTGPLGRILARLRQEWPWLKVLLRADSAYVQSGLARLATAAHICSVTVFLIKFKGPNHGRYPEAPPALSWRRSSCHSPHGDTRCH